MLVDLKRLGTASSAADLLLVPTGRVPVAQILNFRTLLGALLALFFALGHFLGALGRFLGAFWALLALLAAFVVALGWFLCVLGRSGLDFGGLRRLPNLIF